jgi:signal transduction histidine kinase/CheY-like chemotaxis protein
MTIRIFKWSAIIAFTFISSLLIINSLNGEVDHTQEILKDVKSFTSEMIFQTDVQPAKFETKELNYKAKMYVFIILFLLSLMLLVLFFFKFNRNSKRNLKRDNEVLEEKVIERTLNLSYEIDRHKRTEIELKKNEERWNKAQDVAKIGNWDYDMESHKIWGSKQAFKIFKYHKSTKELTASSLLEYIHPNDTKKVINAIGKLKKEGKKLHISFKLNKNNSNEKIVALKAELVYNLDLRPIKISGTIQDITNREKAKRELITAKEKAEESDQLKSAFLSNMSHEIRTPMNAIIGFSDLLEEENIEEDTKKEYIKLIQSNSLKLLNLIDDIIDIAKIEANQIQIRESEILLHQLLDELHKTFKSKTNSKINLILKKVEDYNEISMTTDGFRLQQVLTNLLSNAFKFTDQGDIEFGYTIKNKFLEFFVSDTGIGIPKDSHNIIFDRFRQIDDTGNRLYGGTGLGLSICKCIIELLNGKIWLESKTGGGSTFYFTIPFKSNSKRIARKNKKETEKKFNWNKKTILIAEDEHDSFILLQTILKRTNINIIHAKTGKQAIEYFENEKNIDLILMDIQMPEINGLEATEKIKSIKSDIPIIAQTAFALPGEKQKCVETGCDSYITKPINRTTLLTLLASYLGN